MDPNLFLECARCGQRHAASKLPAGEGVMRFTCTGCGHAMQQRLEPPAGPPPSGFWAGAANARGEAARTAGQGLPPAPPLQLGEEDPRQVAPPAGGSGPSPLASERGGLAAPELRVVHGGGAATAAPLAPPGHVLELPAVPPGHCPACLAERAPAAASCARCGLDFLRADPAQLAPSDRLARDWYRLRQDWESPAAHHRYLERATATGELSAAGRLYRLHLLHQPGDLQATTALDGMMQRALAAGLPQRTRADGEEAERRRRLNRLLQLFLVLLFLAAALMVLTLR